MIFHPRLVTLVAVAGAEARETGTGTGRGARRGWPARHLARCVRCRERVVWAREVREAVRSETRRSAPEGGWAAVEARLDRKAHVLLPAGPIGAAGLGAPLRLWKAAAALVLLTGAASAAVPGLPVRVWLEAVLGSRPTVDEAAATTPAVPDAAGAVTFLIPARDGEVTIALERPAAELRVRVLIAGEADVEIGATGPVAAARFTRAPGRLTIEDAGAGDLVVALPAGLRATMLVDGRPVVRMQDGELVVAGAVRAESSTELTFRVGERGVAP